MDAPKCWKCARREAVCTPVIYVPIRRWPVPLYLQFKGALCEQCAYSFTLKDYTDYDGSWYEMAADHLRSRRVPAQNPYPNDPNFKWEEFMLNPNFDPVPIDECTLHFWHIGTLAAKSMSQSLDSHRR